MFTMQTPFPAAFPLINDHVLESIDGKMPAEDAEFLSSIGNKKNFPKGSTILHYGSKVEKIIYIKKGFIRNSHVSSAGIEKTYSYKGQDCFLGLPAFFHNQPLLYNSIAAEHTEIIFIDKNMLEKICERKSLVVTFFKLLSLESRHLAMQVEDFSLRDTEAKICRILLCQERLQKKLTHQDLACIVGSHRVTVTSILSKLKKEKIITIKKNGEIVVADFEKICQKACK